MFKKYYLSEIFFLVGLFCFILYQTIGSYVDSEGFLKEPFFLIILGMIFTLFSIIIFIIKWIVCLIKNHKLETTT
jgi:hypothetical protein